MSKLKELLLEKTAGKEKYLVKEALFRWLKGIGQAGGRVGQAAHASQQTGGLLAKNILKNSLVLGGAGALIGGGAALAGEIGSAIADPLKKKVGLKRMYRENSFLNREDSGTVSKYYDTLFRFSPTMAMDPLVSGSFMKKQLEFKDIGIQPTDIQTVSNIEKAVRDQRQHALMQQAFAPKAMSDTLSIG